MLTYTPAVLRVTLTPDHVFRALVAIARVRSAADAASQYRTTNNLFMCAHDPFAQAFHDLFGDAYWQTGITTCRLQDGTCYAVCAPYDATMPHMLSLFERVAEGVFDRDRALVTLLDLLPLTLTFDRIDAPWLDGE